MRATTVALLGLFVAFSACSDSTGPDGNDSGFQLENGTYDMVLTDCTECTDNSGSSFAVVWREGIDATIEVLNATEDGAQGRFLSLLGPQGQELTPALETPNVEFSVISGVYRVSVRFLEGEISVAFHDGGCTFDMTYPGVDTGPGTCELEAGSGG